MAEARWTGVQREFDATAFLPLHDEQFKSGRFFE